jgi:hypothetical protein
MNMPVPTALTNDDSVYRRCTPAVGSNDFAKETGFKFGMGFPSAVGDVHGRCSTARCCHRLTRVAYPSMPVSSRGTDGNPEGAERNWHGHAGAQA